MLKQTKFSTIKQQLNQLGFDVVKSLGSGGFGEVVLAVKNGKQYAIKSIPKELIASRPELNKYIRNQYKVMKALQHKNIIKQQGHIQNEQHFFMFLEYCNLGNLLIYQSKKPKKCFTLKQTVKIISDVLKGLKQIHMNKFIHRDIKLQNILLKQENGVVIFKIADFGFARPIQNNSVGTHCGTSSFMAPQILARKPYGISVDLWALAVVMYFMLFGQYPFKSMSMLTDIQAKCSHKFDLKKNVKKDKLQQYTQELADFFSKIFVIDPRKRMTMSQIFIHPLFASNFDFLKEKDSPRSTTQSNGSQQYLNTYKDQIKQLEFQRQKVAFLKNTFAKLSDSIKKILHDVKQVEILSAQFYLLKIMIINTKKCLIALNSKLVASHFSSLPKWKEFCQTNQAKRWIQLLDQELAELNSQYFQLSSYIQKNNIQVPGFNQFYTNDNQFEQFKTYYRSAVGNIFKLIHFKQNISILIKNQLKLQLICCHLINRVFQYKYADTNFQGYYDTNKIFTHKSFIKWISQQNKQALDKTITLLHKRYLNIK